MGEDKVMHSDMVYRVQGHQLETPCTVMFFTTLRETLRESYKVVRQNLEKSASLQKFGHDMGLKQCQLNVGDEVACFITPNSKIKTFITWDGPHTVTMVVSETTVVIRLLKEALTKSHVPRLILWCGVPNDDLEGPFVAESVQTLKTQRAALPTKVPIMLVGVKAKLGKLHRDCTRDWAMAAVFTQGDSVSYSSHANTGTRVAPAM